MQQPHPSTTTAAGQRARRAWIAAVLMAATAVAGTAHAGDVDSEREALSRISGEIEQVQNMVAQAAQNAPAGQRVAFRYDWLQRDLDLMRAGIAEHLEAPREPRPVPPLRGDYRE